MNLQTINSNYRFHIDKEKELCTLYAEGRASIETTLDSIKTVVAHPAFLNNYKMLADIRHIDYNPSFAELMQIRELMEYYSSRYQGRIALVCSGWLFDVCLLLSLYMRRTKIEIQVFKDLEKANQWIETGEECITVKATG